MSLQHLKSKILDRYLKHLGFYWNFYLFLCFTTTGSSYKCMNEPWFHLDKLSNSIVVRNDDIEIDIWDHFVINCWQLVFSTELVQHLNSFPNCFICKICAVLHLNTLLVVSIYLRHHSKCNCWPAQSHTELWLNTVHLYVRIVHIKERTTNVRPALFYTKPFVYNSVAICLIMIKLLHHPV